MVLKKEKKKINMVQIEIFLIKKIIKIKKKMKVMKIMKI
jgi:hypothetical protein